MSTEYDTYIIRHKDNVENAYQWILKNFTTEELDEIFPGLIFYEVSTLIKQHDNSKYNPDEYIPYDNYFYKGGKENETQSREFERAFLLHMHRNPHHWQYWVLIGDDGDLENSKNTMAFDMPDKYIIEMLCDWWSFSWDQYFDAVTKNEENPIDHLYEVFDWYASHKDIMMLGENTRKKVEKVLDTIKTKLSIKD